MAKLKNMAVTAAERKEKEKRYNKPCPSIDGDRYSYGLRVNLEDSDLDKLDLKLPAVGTVMTLTAKVKVTSAEERESEDNGKRRSLGLQITAMALEGGTAKDAVDQALKS